MTNKLSYLGHGCLRLWTIFYLRSAQFGKITSFVDKRKSAGPTLGPQGLFLGAPGAPHGHAWGSQVAFGGSGGRDLGPMRALWPLFALVPIVKVTIVQWGFRQKGSFLSSAEKMDSDAGTQCSCCMLFIHFSLKGLKTGVTVCTTFEVSNVKIAIWF